LNPRPSDYKSDALPTELRQLETIAKLPNPEHILPRCPMRKQRQTRSTPRKRRPNWTARPPNQTRWNVIAAKPGTNPTSTTGTASARSWPIKRRIESGEWSGVRESNPCKSAWKADAQPLGQPRATAIATIVRNRGECGQFVYRRVPPIPAR
jgi:hypothetical protein